MILNIHNPIPILQQKPSSITTNTLIPTNFQQTTDKQIVKINKITKNNNNINQKISSDIIDFFDDFYKKPDNEPLSKYIIQISSKKNRFMYIGIFFILVAFYILFLNYW